MARKPRRQEVRKRQSGKCFFCNESAYEALDAHRIVPGGSYDLSATLCLCANCHRKVHAGTIKVHARLTGAMGNTYIHYTDESGVEHYQKENDQMSPSEFQCAIHDYLATGLEVRLNAYVTSGNEVRALTELWLWNPYKQRMDKISEAECNVPAFARDAA